MPDFTYSPDSSLNFFKRASRMDLAIRREVLFSFVVLVTTAITVFALPLLGFSPVRTMRSVALDGAGAVIQTTFDFVALFFFCAITGLTGTLSGVLFKVLSVQLSGFARTQATKALAHDVASQASRQLSSELSMVLAAVRAHIQSSDTHAGMLAGVHSQLAVLPQAQQVCVIVNLLMAENKRMRMNTDHLRDRLEASKKEVDALKENLEQAEEAGLTDALTGVGNRRCFDTALERAVSSTLKSGGTLSLVMCDIDHFKRVNDSFGHPVGDEVIRMFCQVITKSVRAGDTIARYGGEEFAIILEGADRARAGAIAERVRRQFGDKRLTIRKTNQVIGQLTASFGVAQLTRGERAEMLIHRADAKLYEAKAAGRNRVAGSS